MILQSFLIPIIKVTDSCNFNCHYCHYAQGHLNSKLMDVETCKKIIGEIFEYNIRNHNSRMRIIFHGGEPLLQSIDFYENIIEYEKGLLKNVKDFTFLHSIQTNGYLLDYNWATFFKENQFDLGISIDGDEKYNCHYNNEGVEHCTNRVLGNIQMLNREQIPFGVISVITNNHLKSAEDFYQFCLENEIHDVSLNYCFNEKSNDSVDNIELVNFLKKLFKLYYEGFYELNIREFNEIIAKYMGYCSDTCGTCNRENCGQYLCFDSEENVFFCDTGYDKSTALGNLKSTSILEIINSTKYLKEIIKSRKVFEEKCLICDINQLCGSGCYRYDIGNNGKLIKNYFCKSNKIICEYIRNYLESSEINIDL